ERRERNAIGEDASPATNDPGRTRRPREPHAWLHLSLRHGHRRRPRDDIEANARIQCQRAGRGHMVVDERARARRGEVAWLDAVWPRASLPMASAIADVHAPVPAISRVCRRPRLAASTRPPALNASPASSVVVPARRTVSACRELA